MNAPTDPIDQLAANLADLWANNPDAYTRHAQYDPWCDTRCPRQGHLAGTRRLAHLIRDGDPAALEAVGFIMNEYANLSDRYSKMRDDYESLSSLYEAEHGEF